MNRGIMRIQTIALVIASALAVGSGSTVAAAAPTVKPVAAGPCVFQFHLGAPYIREAAVIGGGYVDCKGAGTPQTFSVTLRLKYKSQGGSWTTRGIEQSDQVPAPVLNIATWAWCEPGGWVAVAEMWDTRDNQTTRYVNESAPTITSC